MHWQGCYASEKQGKSEGVRNFVGLKLSGKSQEIFGILKKSPEDILTSF